MRFSISASERRPSTIPWGRFVLATLGSAFLLGSAPLSSAKATEWTVAPRLGISGGHESDLLLDPALDRSVVPAGAFVDLTPSLSLRTRPGARSLFRAGTTAVLERYLNDDGRRLYAQSAYAEWTQGLAGSGRLRLRADADYFADSERTTVRRGGGGLEAALGIAHRNWSLEAIAGLQGRRYPELEVADRSGSLGTYTERTWVVGSRAVFAWPRTLVVPEARIRFTGARDLLFDSTALDLRIRSAVELGDAWSVTASVQAEFRSFSERAPAEDSDQLLSAGVGIRYQLGLLTSVVARFSQVRYTRTDDSDVDTQRVEFGLQRSFSGAWTKRPDRPTATLITDRVSRTETPLPNFDPRRPAFDLPDAHRVYLVGDFNGWNRSSHPLRRMADGRWSLDSELPPGIHQVRLWVDGRWVLPRELERTVDDGFGGRNAVLVVPAPTTSPANGRGL